MSDDRPWFRAKAYGYGAGLPLRWQGWMTLALFLAVIGIGNAALLPRHRLMYLLVVALDVAVFAWVAAHRTQGGWRWRRGSAR